MQGLCQKSNLKEDPYMRKIEITAFELAERFIGISEVVGVASNPQVLAMLQLDERWPVGDDVPWCSAFVNYICWLLRLPRSKGLSARSWLLVGSSVYLRDAEVGFDVVILKRGKGDQPGPEVIKAPGHVGFYGGRDEANVFVLGGNQGDAVNVSRFDWSLILGIRRIY
jgi:uncharacterized protein (TIGR02594 family)